MPLDAIQHFLVHTDDVEVLADWFEQNLGLTRGDTPDFKVPVVWLFIGDHDVIHIAEFPDAGKEKRFQEKYLGGRKTDVTHGSGVIDHVAFRCTGLAGMIARLDGEHASYLKRQANVGDLFQLFIDAPNGLRIELNFSSAEAEASGIEPDMTAAEAVAVG
ncbi:MAG: hypothetical protein HOL07_03230 [Rhodospirillaceae bacterium]|jgi:hypothetical protein|nr:hypothetical protein [Rhodospirillaceae bacterium]MBT3810802.1 hypothetical protein [Rhodospirillaceae bacterium]MBT3932416.1 hypothetical protein [Rhodospirillaceae bacterium]MBT4771602.1 hypothetical protein [Rhodospirillaceae bacterium]MBT5357335.1 hypothetical protein [Rhodospirillaceae bacterium]